MSHNVVIVDEDPDNRVIVDADADKVVVRDDATRTVVSTSRRNVSVSAAGARGPQGPPGVPGGGSGSLVVKAAAAISQRSVVALNAAGEAYLPDKDVAADAVRVTGVAATAALPGDDLLVVTDGVLDGGPWSVGPLFLGDAGALTSAPGGGLFQIQVAVAVTPTRILVRPQFPIFL